MSDPYEKLLSPAAVVAAAMQIEPHLGCWTAENDERWEWRRGRECAHAERILRAAIDAALTHQTAEERDVG